VTGHEIDVVVDHGATATGIELKSGMTIVSDFIKGLTFWQELTGFKKCYVIYGGEEVQKRSENIEIIPWNKRELYESLV